MNNLCDLKRCVKQKESDFLSYLRQAVARRLGITIPKFDHLKSISSHLLCTPAAISRVAIFPKISSKYRAFISPVPGRLHQIFCIVNASPEFIGAMFTAHEYAKSMVTCSSAKIHFSSPLQAGIEFKKLC